jgi:multidrug efflux pump subunit AcrA (membrane-fusion protein)
MRLSEGELRDGYQAHTSRPSRVRSDCPTADELVAAASAESSQEAREAVADHLIACSDCAQEFRLLQALSASVEEAGPALPATAREPARSRRWFEARPARAPLALAASVLIAIALGAAVVALGWRTRQLAGDLAGKDRALTEARQRLTEAGQQTADAQTQLARAREGLAALSKPQLNVPIVDLDPGDAFRGPERSRKTIDVPADGASVTLILNVVGDQSYPRYGLDIVDRTGRLVWSGDGLTRSPINTFTIAIPRAFISTGAYRLKLFGIAEKGRQLIEDYAVTFRIH